MYTSIILNIFSLRKIHGLPTSLVHLEMQVIIRYTRMDRITISLMTRGNRIFKITSITFIFDRGKNGDQNKKTVTGILNLQYKFTYNQIQQLRLSMSNSKMPSMYSYAEVTKHKPSSDRKSSEKKIGNNQLNDISSQYENNRKINKHASPLLQHAQLLQTTYENTLEKMMSINPVENMIALIRRAEKIIVSNCILLTGLPLISD